MLRWMSIVTKEDKIRNNYIKVSIRVASIEDKIRKNKLKWLEQNLIREEMEAVRVI